MYGRIVGGRDDCEGEKVVLSTEPEFSSGESWKRPEMNI